MSLTTPLRATSVLRRSKRCITRQQVDQYLFYNPATDEMHLIPPAGHYIFALCNSFRTVEDIEDLLLGHLEAESTVVTRCLHSFLEQLVERGVLEVADD